MLAVFITLFSGRQHVYFHRVGSLDWYPVQSSIHFVGSSLGYIDSLNNRALSSVHVGQFSVVLTIESPGTSNAGCINGNARLRV